MEQPIPVPKRSAELDSVKRHIVSISQLKTKHADDKVPPPGDRPRKTPVAQVPVCEPPTPSPSASAGSASTINVTIKSLKPALSFQLACQPTESISALKAQLSKQDSAAPPPDAQRWLLKGKALADDKLLQEYNIEEGASIVLMIKPGATTSASTPPMTPSADVPSITLSSAPTSNSQAKPYLVSSKPVEATSGSEHSHPPGISEAFATSMADPILWLNILKTLKARFRNEGMDEEETDRSARRVFEEWLRAAQEWLTPSEKAKIRDATGIHGLAGL